MVEVRRGAIELTWDGEKRLAFLRFERETRATGVDARFLVGAMAGWVGADERPFGLLGDGAKLGGLDAEYRSTWSAFLRRHKDRCSVAFFHMSPVIRIAAEMFRIGTGLQLKAFAKEDDARAWLRKQGIPA